MITISVINQKGGVAKTTTAHAIGTGLALAGHRILLIDLDMQRSLTAIARAHTDVTILHVLNGTAPITEAVQAVYDVPGADIIPGDKGLALIDNVLHSTGKEHRLKEKLEELRQSYDYCIIDCPPTLNILTINALTASTHAVIPTTANYLSLQGINQLKETLEAVQTYTNRKLKIAGILVTQYNGRAILQRDALSIIETKAVQDLHTRVFKTKIRNGTAIQEAQALKKSIFAYAPKSNVAMDYATFINELKEVL